MHFPTTAVLCLGSSLIGGSLAAPILRPFPGLLDPGPVGLPTDSKLFNHTFGMPKSTPVTTRDRPASNADATGPDASPQFALPIPVGPAGVDVTVPKDHEISSPFALPIPVSPFRPEHLNKTDSALLPLLHSPVPIHQGPNGLGEFLKKASGELIAGRLPKLKLKQKKREAAPEAMAMAEAEAMHCRSNPFEMGPKCQTKDPNVQPGIGGACMGVFNICLDLDGCAC
ncbi:hypothetical protein LTR85_011226 [Meristemomyces frigidus]|nr:hypothetical protein LTR85_011226 [Meristemomyces frigidus]